MEEPLALYFKQHKLECIAEHEMWVQAGKSLALLQQHNRVYFDAVVVEGTQ